MKKCDCYEIINQTRYDALGSFVEKYGICNGTKECDVCSCGGDRAKCDFYESFRKEAQHKMNTAEMYIKAKEDGKTYHTIVGHVCFQKDKGLFSDTDLTTWSLNAWEGRLAFNRLMETNWEVYDSIFMSKKEAEKKYNIKIVG